MSGGIVGGIIATFWAFIFYVIWYRFRYINSLSILAFFASIPAALWYHSFIPILYGFVILIGTHLITATISIILASFGK